MYEGVLIDYENIIRSNNLSNLSKLIDKKQLEYNCYNGLFIVIPKKYYDLLVSKTASEKIKYINSVKFIKNIIFCTIVNYNLKKKVCFIKNFRDKNIAHILLNTLMVYLPNDTVIMIKNINNKKLYNELGFEIFGKSALKYNYHDVNVKVNILKNFIYKPRDNKRISTLKLRFAKPAAKYLKNLPYSGTTINDDKSLSQKEITGRFVIKKEGGVNVIYICKNMFKGNEETTKIVNSSYNFHLHPKEAYISNKVNLGWPSSQDMQAFLTSIFRYNTIFHVVVTMEGLYILSLYKYWLNKKEILESDLKSLHKFIYNKYEIEQGTKIDNYKYLQTVNKVKYNKKKLFVVQFLNWESLDKIFCI
jgi:hypothetical protein